MATYYTESPAVAFPRVAYTSSVAGTDTGGRLFYSTSPAGPQAARGYGQVATAPIAFQLWPRGAW